MKFHSLWFFSGEHHQTGAPNIFCEEESLRRLDAGEGDVPTVVCSCRIVATRKMPRFGLFARDVERAVYLAI